MSFLAVLTTLLVACAGGQATPTPPPATVAPATTDAGDASYACPMHPEVRQDAPGKCPTCGMDLVLAPTGPLPEHDHRSLHGGQVSMHGDHHLEYLAAQGEYRVWVTNAHREPITTGVSGSLVDGGTTVALRADDAQGLLVGKGEGAGTRPVMVEVTAEGKTFSLGFAPATPATDDHQGHAHGH